MRLKSLRTLTKFVNDHSQTIFAIGSTILSLASVGLTAWGTVKAVKELEYLDKVKPNATKWELTKKVAPYYIPAAVATVGSIGCTWKSHNISADKLAHMGMTLNAVKDQFNAYRELNGENDKNILEKRLDQKEENEKNWEEKGYSGDEILRWYEPVSKQWFESTTADVMEACYTANRLFIGTCSCSFSTFLNCLGFDEKDTYKWNNIGWYQYSGEVYYGYTWIDFNFKEKRDKKGRYMEIVYPFPPHHDEK